VTGERAAVTDLSEKNLLFLSGCCYFVVEFQPDRMKLKFKILIHVAFWAYMYNQILLTVAMWSGKEIDLFEQITIYPVTSFLTFYSFYLTYGLFFSRTKKTIPVITLILVFAALVPLRIGLEYLFWKHIGFSHLKPGMVLSVDRSWWFNSLRLTIIYGIYALLIKLAIGWYEAQKLKTGLMLEKQAGELALLRSQINPHFLFNTLNNIYSLVYKKSDDAPEAVMRMSAIMRYMLYDATTDQVLLEKEVEYLKSFIELEKLRIRHTDFVDLTITGNMEGRTIAPMLLIPFVENAFKHGSRNAATPGIIVRLEVTSSQILFEVTDYVRKNIAAPRDQAGGIGLANIRRRLNLLYPGKHQLVTTAGEETFHIRLTLDL